MPSVTCEITPFESNGFDPNGRVIAPLLIQSRRTDVWRDWFQELDV